MSKMEKNGMEKLAKVLDLRMGEHSGGGFSFDFGVIKKDYSLVSNTFPLPIPKRIIPSADFWPIYQPTYLEERTEGITAERDHIAIRWLCLS